MKRYSVFYTPEAYTTMTHSRCMKQTLRTKLFREIDATLLQHVGRNRIGVIIKKEIHGLRYCKPCGEFVERDRDAAIVQLALVLAAEEIFKKNDNIKTKSQ